MTELRAVEFGPLEAAGAHGLATPLLLLHGIGAGASAWVPAARTLATRRRVLVPDLLGFGSSPWPEVSYGVHDHLSAILNLLERRGLAAGPLDVAGHSMGAILAAELAVRLGHRARRIALVSLPYFRSEVEAKQAIGTLGVLARLTVLDHWAAGTVCAAMCALRPQLRWLAPHFARHVPADVARDTVMHNYASYSRSLREVIVRHRLEPALERLADRDILLIHGDADRSAPIEHIRPLTARFPHWRLETVPGADHALPIVRAGTVARLLEIFLAPGSPPAGGEPGNSREERRCPANALLPGYPVDRAPRRTCWKSHTASSTSTTSTRIVMSAQYAIMPPITHPIMPPIPPVPSIIASLLPTQSDNPSLVSARVLTNSKPSQRSS